jgi:hypothetical protein
MAAYPENIGFVEMIHFYNVADNFQQKAMDKIVKSANWVEFIKLIRTVLGVELKV